MDNYYHIKKISTKQGNFKNKTKAFLMLPQIFWGPTKRLPIINFTKLEHLMKWMYTYYYQTLKYIFFIIWEHATCKKTVFKWALWKSHSVGLGLGPVITLACQIDGPPIINGRLSEEEGWDEGKASDYPEGYTISFCSSDAS